ncbi:LysR family transcriptional regulator [Verticiella sediminum]|nr:LysR family transcriptional regulator [Verticiella sediminum]
MPLPPTVAQGFRTHLKPRQAELLVALAEEQHLGRAADRAHMTQPAASRALAQIEHMVGLALFVRSAQGMRATPAGEVMTAYARHLLGIGERTAAELAALHAQATHTLRVGVLPSTASTLAPRLLQALLRTDPALQVVLTEDGLHELIDALRRGSLDLVLGRMAPRPPEDELLEYPVRADPIVVVCRPGHALARLARAHPAQLAACGWILPPPDTVLRERLEELFRQADVALPPGRVHSNSTLANLELVRQTDLLAVLPQGLAEQYAARRELHIVPLDVAFTFGEVGAVVRRNRIASAALDAALAWLRQQRSAGGVHDA